MTIRMTEQEAVSYLTPNHMTGDGACIGLTAWKMREAMDTLHGVVAAKTARIASLEALVRELAGALEWMVENDDTNEGDEPLSEHGGYSWNEINAYWIAGLNRSRSALSHPIVSELTGEKERVE